MMILLVASYVLGIMSYYAFWYGWLCLKDKQNKTAYRVMMVVGSCGAIATVVTYFSWIIHALRHGLI